MAKKKNVINMFVFLGCFLLLLAGILVTTLLFKGSTTIVNGSADVNSVESLACEGAVSYPFLENNDNSKKSLKINITFNNDKLDSMSLIYKVYFSTASEIEKNTSNNNVTMVKKFSADGFSADLIGAHFSKLKDATQMTLYVNEELINPTTAKYFLLDGLDGKYSRERVSEVYNKKGLNCVISN